MKSTRDRVTPAAEFTAGVKNRQNHFNRRLLFSGVHVDGNATTVIDYANGAVLEDANINFGAVPRERFVY